MGYKLTPVIYLRGRAFPLPDKKAEHHDKPSRETKALMYFPYHGYELAFRKRDLMAFGHEEAVLQEVE